MTKNVPMKRIYALKTTKTDNISWVTLFILGIAASKVQFGVVRNKESSIKFTYYHVCMYVCIFNWNVYCTKIQIMSSLCCE